LLVRDPDMDRAKYFHLIYGPILLGPFIELEPSRVTRYIVDTSNKWKSLKAIELAKDSFMWEIDVSKAYLLVLEEHECQGGVFCSFDILKYNIRLKKRRKQRQRE
jgi:hypothetical protein